VGDPERILEIDMHGFSSLSQLPTGVFPRFRAP
jgi:hypothetical protein